MRTFQCIRTTMPMPTKLSLPTLRMLLMPMQMWPTTTKLPSTMPSKWTPNKNRQVHLLPNKTRKFGLHPPTILNSLPPTTTVHHVPTNHHHIIVGQFLRFGPAHTIRRNVPQSVGTDQKDASPWSNWPAPMTDQPAHRPSASSSPGLSSPEMDAHFHPKDRSYHRA